MTEAGEQSISGYVNFFLVRGDSAGVPADVSAPHDSTRWYVERWEDDTFLDYGAQAMPTKEGDLGLDQGWISLTRRFRIRNERLTARRAPA